MSEPSIRVIQCSEYTISSEHGDYARMINQGYIVKLITARKESREYVIYEVLMEKPSKEEGN